MTLPRATISPWVIPSCGTSLSSVVNHAQLARGNQLDALPGFDRGSLVDREGRVFRPLFADGDERRCLSQSVNVGNRPAKFFFESLDGGRSGRRTGGDNSNSFRREATHIFRRIRQRNQNRRRRAEHGYLLVRHQFEDSARLDFAQTDVSRARGSYRPDESPAVGVKHRQRPEITIGTSHGLMDQRADRIHPGVAVSDHHALRARSCAAGVIDREQIGLANFRTA